jgi:tetratricopeptide (TPR) repeat protein
VDPTIIVPAADSREPHAVEAPACTIAKGQVVVGDIPALRPGFQPRPALLAQLNRVGEGPPVVLTGTRGAGKTQLAAAYARARLAARWRLVAWVNARDSLTLQAGLAAVADATGLSVGGSRPGPAEAGEAVRDWLEADGSLRLLVFDDVEDPGLLRPFVPAAGEARVLIIAARQPMAELGTNVPVDVFSADEALALLGERTALADEDGALAVAVQLGYLPLALDQAAGMIAKQQHMGYAAYLARLRALSAEDHLAREDEAEEQSPPGVAEAVLLAMEAASYADRLGVSIKVMELVAMLSPAVVRRDLLRSAGQAGTLLGGGRRIAASMVDQTLERLNERSLLGFSLDGEAVSVHRLAAQVIRAGLARQERLVPACRVAASAVEGSSAALAKHRNHAAVTELAGQVEALAENARAAPDDAEELATMLARLRSLALNHLAELGDTMPEVIAIGEPLAADLYRLLGPDDPDTIRARTALARAYHQTGRVDDAIPLVEQILAAREQLFGADHPGTLAARNNLASAYRATGRAAEAIPLFERNVAMCERLFGADHPKTLASRHHLDRARQELAESETAGHRPKQE